MTVKATSRPQKMQGRMAASANASLPSVPFGSDSGTSQPGANVRDCNRHIDEALEAVRNLIILADEGERDAEDDRCMILYAVIRDCAYRIRLQAEKERERHIADGKWDGHSHAG